MAVSVCVCGVGELVAVCMLCVWCVCVWCKGDIVAVSECVCVWCKGDIVAVSVCVCVWCQGEKADGCSRWRREGRGELTTRELSQRWRGEERRRWRGEGMRR